MKSRLDPGLWSTDNVLKTTTTTNNTKPKNIHAPPLPPPSCMWRRWKQVNLQQVDLTSFLASEASFLGREAAERATKLREVAFVNRTKDFFESLRGNEWTLVPGLRTIFKKIRSNKQIPTTL